MNIFIIDDEIQVRKWLGFCISHCNPEFILAGESSGVKEGIDKMRSLSVDILILDIMLPEMNGLEGLARIKQLFPSISVVMLTNYAEFEYIQKAVRSGAEEYFLKSELTEDELTACLRKLAFKKSNISLPPSEEYERLTLTSLASQILNHTITGKEMFQQAIIKLPPLLSFHYNLTVLALRHAPEQKPDLSDIAPASISPYLSTILCLSCAKDITFIVCEMDKLRSSLSIINALSEVTSWISQHLVFHYMGISNIYYSFSDFYSAITEACLSMRYGFYKSPGAVTYIWDTNSAVLSQSVLQKFNHEILIAIRNKDIQTMYQVLQNIFTYFKNMKPENLDSVSLYLQNLTFLVLSTCIPNLTENHFMENIRLSFSNYMESLYLDDIKEHMFSTLHILESDFHLPQYSQPVIDALSFIDEHFCENISLQDTASHIHMNADYLGKIFKKEVSVSFHTYLTRKKMEYADYLIRTTNLRKYEVAEKIGYVNFSYFSRVYNAYKNTI